MKIVNKKIADLIAADYNPRQMTVREYENILDSLTKFGFATPVVINTKEGRENIIIGGHQRVRIWKDLGNKTVPCSLECLDLEEEMELNLRLNKNTGHWDYDQLSNNFEEEKLKDVGFTDTDLGKTAFYDEPEPTDTKEEKNGIEVLVTCTNELEKESLKAYLTERNITFKVKK